MLPESQGDTACSYCGAATHEDNVNMALWEGERLVVIEDVPARVCKGCFEQFYDDIVRFEVDQLRGEGFPLAAAERVVEVPVFSLAKRHTGSTSK